jgi:hypothetical protein
LARRPTTTEATLLTTMPVDNRVLRLEEALARIQRECDFALDEPHLVITTVCRIAAVTRRALADDASAAAVCR